MAASGEVLADQPRWTRPDVAQASLRGCVEDVKPLTVAILPAVGSSMKIHRMRVEGPAVEITQQ
jgi:hypothetical protein